MKSYNNKGNWGELFASQFLEKKDYKIIRRNYKTKYGEIDIICRQNNLIIFVEVKMRSVPDYLKACDSISVSKMDKIRKAASLFLNEIDEPGAVCRFDVIFVFGNKNKNELYHIENAF
ncbi:MAG: YraN family protein [Spirochaetota bacterium]